MDVTFIIPCSISVGSLLVAFWSLLDKRGDKKEQDLEKKFTTCEKRLNDVVEDQHATEIEVRVLTERVTNEINIVHKIDQKLDEIQKSLQNNED